MDDRVSGGDNSTADVDGSAISGESSSLNRGENAAAGEERPSVPKGPKESFYDRIPLTKKQLDIIIIILVAAIILFFVLGVLSGNGTI